MEEVTIHLLACKSAFNVMLVGIAAAKGIDVRPGEFRDKVDKKRSKAVVTDRRFPLMEEGVHRSLVRLE